MWIAAGTAGTGHGRADRRPALRCQASHGGACCGKRRLRRSGGQPATRSAAKAGRHAARLDDGGDRRARTAHRRRRPEHEPVRLPEPRVGPAGGFRHRRRTRDRARHLRRSGPHRSAGGRGRPPGRGVAVRGGRPGGPDLLDHLRPQEARRVLHARTSTPTRRSSPSRDRESILPLHFRASGCAR